MSKVLEIKTGEGSKIDLITEPDSGMMARDPVYHLLSKRETYAGWVQALRYGCELTRGTAQEGAAKAVPEGVPPQPEPEPEPER